MAIARVGLTSAFVYGDVKEVADVKLQPLDPATITRATAGDTLRPDPGSGCGTSAA